MPSGEGISIGASSTASSRRRKSRPRRKTRDKLIPTDCALNVTNDRVYEIERELRKLSHENFTNAVSVLFRVFIELSVDEYNERNAVAEVSENSKLVIKMSKAASHMVNRRKLSRQQAKAVRSAAQKDSFLASSVTQMNQYVHNKHVFPAPSDLRSGWDSLQRSARCRHIARMARTPSETRKTTTSSITAEFRRLRPGISSGA